MGLAGRMAHAFIDSKLTPLVVITSVLLGVAAILLLPREEEPQIKVPMIDVLVAMPGFSAKEVGERATRPMEKLLWEIPGVEYTYSTSRPGESLAIVRFKVGEDVEKSLVKLNQKLQSNFDHIPQGVSQPLIKLRSIDDVPILALTFHSAHHDHLTLRRLVAQVDDAVKQVPLVAETTIIGGARRQLRVLFDPLRLASRQLSVPDIVQMLGQANRQSRAGGLTGNNQETLVEMGGFLSSAQDVGNVVVGVFEARPVYLRDVADIKDGAEEPSQYVFSGSGAARAATADEQPAVTLSIAKRPGANAISVANQVLKKVDTLKGRSGMPVDLLHVPRDKKDVDIVLQLPRANRTTPDELLALRVRSEVNPSAPLVPLREIVKVEQTTVDRSIYHKNLMPVTYVIGDVAGVVESPAYAILRMNTHLLLSPIVPAPSP
jgi:multidrug efflux pump subunit AcrB